MFYPTDAKSNRQPAIGADLPSHPVITHLRMVVFLDYISGYLLIQVLGEFPPLPRNIFGMGAVAATDGHMSSKAFAGGHVFYCVFIKL